MNGPCNMTPGPTRIASEVLAAQSREGLNPDLDPEFLQFYRELCKKLQRHFKSSSQTLALSGEGILGLEAACASLTERGKKVLCLSNGPFGAGFADFASIYGARVSLFEGDYREPLDPKKLEHFLSTEKGFSYATLVHCETPTGVLNDLSELCPLLKKHGIATVVDAVSSLGGVPIDCDALGIDILLGASQKCLSAPAGASILSISNRAWQMMEERRERIASYYCNLSLWRNWQDSAWFPYTLNVNTLQGLSRALDKSLADEDIFQRHESLAQAVRDSLQEGGLELYGKRGFSPTVTSILLPKEIDGEKLLERLRVSYGVLMAPGAHTEERFVLRLGHMGENCRQSSIWHSLLALDKALREQGHSCKVELHNCFSSILGQRELFFQSH